MSNFYIDYKISVAPIEELIGADNTDTSRIINSNIDKILSSSYELTCSGVNGIKYNTYTTTTSGVAVSTLLSFSGDTCNTLFLRIISAAASSTPNLYLSIDSGSSYPLIISGVGNFMKLGLATVDTKTILIKSSGSTTLANIELIGAQT